MAQDNEMENVPINEQEALTIGNINSNDTLKIDTVIQETSRDIDEEELEYESQDDDDFEKVCVESQMKEYNVSQLINYNENDLNDHVVNEEAFEAEFNENDDGPLLNEAEEEQYYEKRFLQEMQNEEQTDGQANGQENENKQQQLRELITLHESDIFETQEHGNELEYEGLQIDQINDNDNNNVHLLSDSEDDIVVTKEVNKNSSKNTENMVVIYDDDDNDESEQKLEYVRTLEIDNSEIGDADEDDEFEKSIELIGKLSKLCIFFDFCDLVSSTDELNSVDMEKIKPHFDILKLFKTETSEDAVYSELECIYHDFEECVNLTFGEIFCKLGELMKIDLNKTVIHLTVSELLNFSVSSDSLSSANMLLRDLLGIYETLKSQSPNSDFYKFLSIRVWCSLSINEQMNVLFSSSKVGYHLGNIKEIVSKRNQEQDEIFQRSNKRKKV